MNIYDNKKEKIRRRRNFYRIYIGIILIIFILIFFIINSIISFLLSEKSRISETSNIYQLKSKIISSNYQNNSIHYIYIDIGCFNGETIEHFLHFIPNSSIYDIITFEPDPDNYELCKERLKQKKYMNINIIILQKVVWIRNEKIFFQIERGRQSRIITNITADDNDSKQFDAIDFSSWLADLAEPNRTKIHIKMSMPGAEVLVLNKMILDNTFELADKYEVEWTDRENPQFRAIRIYIQSMFDTYGFDCLYYTRLQDVRKVFEKNGTFENVTKYYNWKLISEFDTFAHYVQRPDVLTPPYILKKPK